MTDTPTADERISDPRPTVAAGGDALFTDLYELSMLQAYFAEGMDREAVFSLYVRTLPARRNYLIACGLESVLEQLENLRFSAADIAYLEGLDMFTADFLDWLRDFRFTGSVRAVAEGTPMFGEEPILEVTASLPEAQLDRFAMELSMGYPPADQEIEILMALTEPPRLTSLQPVTNLEEVVAERTRVQQMHVDPDLCRYIVDLLEATRTDTRLSLGVSPRGGISLYRMAQGHAAVAGRDAVQPDDIKAVAVNTLAHRLSLETKAKYSGVSKRGVVEDLLERVPVPV